MQTLRVTALFPAAFVALLLTACEKPRPLSEQLDAAEAALTNGEYGAAMQGFREAVAGDPENPLARGALAHAEYWLGDLASAEHNGRRALELGDTSARTAATYLRTRIALNAAGDALRELEAGGLPIGGDERLALRAEALLALGRYEDALDLLAGAAPDRDAGSRQFLAGRAKLGLQKPGEALASLSRVEAASGYYGEALLLLANLAQSRGEPAEAEQFSNELVALGSGVRLPLLVAATRMQFDLRMTQGKVAEARQPLSELKKLVPDEAGTLISDARMAIVDGDSRRVIGPLQTLLGRHPENPHARLLLGMALIENGNPRQGEQQLNWLLANNPDFSAARAALARAKILQGRVDAAHSLLADAGPVTDPELAELLGQVKLQLGHAGEALAYLSSDTPIENRSDSALLDLAEAQLRVGNTSEARRLLTSREFGPAMASRAGRLRFVLEALALGPQQAVRRLQTALTDDPEDVELRLLAASVLTGSLDDREQAERELELVLASQPENVGALYQLADIRLRARDYDGAVAHLMAIRELNIDSVPAVTTLAWIATARGEGGEADRWIGELSRIGSPRANYDLLRLLLARGNGEAASRLAGSLTEEGSSRASNTHLVGIAYLQSGRPSDAMPFLVESTRIAPGVAEFWYYRAAAEFALNEYDLALNSLAEATGLRPGWARALRLTVQALVAAGRPEAAIALARKRSSGVQKDLEGQLLLAETLLASKRAAEADEVFAELPIAALSRAAVYRWATARRAAGLENPNAPYRRWLEQFPGDARMRMILVQALHQSGARDEARRQLEPLLEARPDDAVILNNIAWYLYDLDSGALDTALGFARRAAELTPDNASVLDTQGWLELRAGNASAAIGLLERAASLEPDNRTIAEHLREARRQR
ncbi:MAG: tetratricopeptide repeat protein [Pseudomonadota bacterium]